MKKVLRFENNDNVAVALEALQPDDVLIAGTEVLGVRARAVIPQGHKVALNAIPQGAQVCKYGHVIGIAKEDIAAGDYVHVHNVIDPTGNWKERTKTNYDPAAVQEIPEDFVLEKMPELTGYKRNDGSVGFRNYLLIVSTCVCGNQPVDNLRVRFRNDKDVVCITNPSGCILIQDDREMQENMLFGLAKNPNVGAVIFVGLGCEAVLADKLYERMRNEKPAACYIAQEYESCEAVEAAIAAKAEELLSEIRSYKRVKASVADIRLGVQCGASDWTTAAAANPVIGYCSDLVVKNGGISILGETCGWFGGEEVLIRQSRAQETAEKIDALLEKIYDRCLFYGRKIDEANPAPGNIAGGITTLTEKALGNTMKGGMAPIEGVLDVGEQPAGKGFYVSDNPGLDAPSVFAQTMSSCNVIVYSTGRGSPVGTPIAPVIKLTASPTAADRFASHMDVILTDLVLEGVSIAEGGWRLFDKVIAVCDGEESIAEAHGHREYSFPLMMGPM